MIDLHTVFISLCKLPLLPLIYRLTIFNEEVRVSPRAW